MATSTARRKRKRLTTCDFKAHSEVWIPQLFTPSPALTFILKLLVCIILERQFGSLQIKPKENDNKQLFSLQEENVGLKTKIQTLEQELQSAHKLRHSTKNQLEGELLDLKKKLRDTEAKYSNLVATRPKVSLSKPEMLAASNFKTKVITFVNQARTTQ